MPQSTAFPIFNTTKHYNNNHQIDNLYDHLKFLSHHAASIVATFDTLNNYHHNYYH